MFKRIYYLYMVAGLCLITAGLLCTIISFENKIQSAFVVIIGFLTFLLGFARLRIERKQKKN